MTVHAGSLTHILPPPPIETLRRPALFLDMDGVLAPLAPHPDDVVPVARRTAVLKQLIQRLDGRVAIVSGRTLAEIDRISDGAAQAASGVHGLERRGADGVSVRDEADPAVKQAVAAFNAFAAERPGVVVEDKGVAAGLHYRRAPDQGGAAQALASEIADRTGLVLQPGSMVLELKTPGTDKGTAVTAFMDQPPFKGAFPIMVGDDLTDEHGFAAATALGGFGVLVGPPRETAARYGLADVDAVLDWLEAVAASVSETPA
ncbi:trehalose-phosphatase [Brevundimonas vitis]|uniref:Trehalose 6-phosphate phosphatase n=1 Tax=Brevundimonas vitisensis TaxID=2800818 RepID=A0ABX7BKE1_9CAUL|nr:trehalose-phosphatase [Brevundimonas vitisensis]QQQ18042.1 trehalose-phosphatase [Brevundimonas vitisensis]